MTNADTLKEYRFTDEQIEILLNVLRDNAQYETEEIGATWDLLVDHIEDQRDQKETKVYSIVNDLTNSWNSDDIMCHSPKWHSNLLRPSLDPVG